MFVHIFAFRWRAKASCEDRDRAHADILAFRERIPGLRDIHVGENVSPKSQDYGLTGVMLFADQSAYNAYQVSELHARLLEWLVPLIDAIELDFND